MHVWNVLRFLTSCRKENIPYLVAEIFRHASFGRLLRSDCISFSENTSFLGSFGAVFRSQLCAASEQRQICDRASGSQMKPTGCTPRHSFAQLKSHVREKYHLVRLRQMSCKPYMRNPEWQLPEAKNKDVLKDADGCSKVGWDDVSSHVVSRPLCQDGIIAISGGNGALGLVMGLWILRTARRPGAAKNSDVFKQHFPAARLRSRAARNSASNFCPGPAKHWMVTRFSLKPRCVTRSPARRSMKISDQNMPNWKDSKIFLGTWEFGLQWCVFRQELESLAQSLGIHVEQAKCDVSKQVPHQNMKTWLCMS